ncbi:MAG: hypothetical protein K2G80_06630 [Bacteroidales bacterium]|nr:hypothetical protein [Bacteroidales bacterium]
MKTEPGDLGQFRTGQELMDRTGQELMDRAGQELVDKTRQHMTYHNEKRIQPGLCGRSPKGYRSYMMHHGAARRQVAGCPGNATEQTRRTGRLELKR